MRGSYKIARLLGVDLKVHWTFLILLAWMFLSFYGDGQQLESGLWGSLAVILLFACVVAHEYGHSLAARRYGIKTQDITLLPIGGVAQLERMPENPRAELVVALAGPAVNVVIALVLFVYLLSTGQEVDFLGFIRGGIDLSPRYLAENLFEINVALVLFNLIPAFPMDGGRVLRAVLAMRWDRAKATRLAAGIGRTLAVAFVFFGFFYSFWLVFIGLFVYLGALGEARQVITRSALAGAKVGDVLMTNYTPLYEHDSLQKAVDLLLAGQEKEFLVFDLESVVVGVLTRESIISGLSSGTAQRVKDVALSTPLTLFTSMSLEEAYELMMREKATVCPVYEGQELVGMLNQENVQEFLLIRSSEARDDEEDIYDGAEALEPSTDAPSA